MGSPWSLVPGPWSKTTDQGLWTRDLFQSRRPSRAVTGQAVAGAAERPDAPEDPTASFAAVRDLSPLSEALQGGRHRRRAPPHADLPGELLKEGPVPDARAARAERPGVRGLVPERLLALGGRKVRGDRDAVRRPVDDLASRELAPRQAHARRVKAEARGEPVVETLQADLVVRFLEREEAHRLRLADNRRNHDSQTRRTGGRRALRLRGCGRGAEGQQG